MDRSAKYLKSLVGAPGFEPGASCAQGRRKAAANPRHFSLHVENPGLLRPFGMCADVPGCGRKFVGSLQKSLHLAVRTQ